MEAEHEAKRAAKTAKAAMAKEPKEAGGHEFCFYRSNFAF